MSTAKWMEGKETDGCATYGGSEMEIRKVRVVSHFDMAVSNH